MYKRIIIYGGVGAGKTTFAKKLGKVLGIKVYSGDFIVANKNWKHRSEGEREKIFGKIVKKNEWIIEGGKTSDWMLHALEKADTIILLDLKKIVLIFRVLKRFREGKKKGNAYGKLGSFFGCVKFASRYNKNSYLCFRKFVEKNRFIVLKNDGEAEEFLENLKNKFK